MWRPATAASRSSPSRYRSTSRARSPMGLAYRHRRAQTRRGVPHLADIEQKFGVPREILIAIWSRESALGASSRATSTSSAPWLRWPPRAAGADLGGGRELIFGLLKIIDSWGRRPAAQPQGLLGRLPWARLQFFTPFLAYLADRRRRRRGRQARHLGLVGRCADLGGQPAGQARRLDSSGPGLGARSHRARRLRLEPDGGTETAAILVGRKGRGARRRAALERR